MKPRKERQTANQKTMRDFALMVYENLQYGADLMPVAKAVWKLHPKEYSNFNSFYFSVWSVASKYLMDSTKSKKNIR